MRQTDCTRFRLENPEGNDSRFGIAKGVTFPVLHLAEVEAFRNIARRIAALLSLADELDGNYRRVAA